MANAGVIWDVDGTLVDTAELHFDAWVKLAAELNRPFTRQDYAATFGRRNPEIIHYLFGEQYSAQQVDELGERKERYYRSEAAHGVTLLPGVARLLELYHDHGIPQAIGSSAPRGNLELILDLAGIRRFFSGVVAMEDTRKGKPDPEVFLTAAQRLQVDPDRCLVFEDALAGVQAAKAGGMKCVAVRFVGHHSEESLQRAGADLVVPCLDRLQPEQALALVQ